MRSEDSVSIHCFAKISAKTDFSRFLNNINPEHLVVLLAGPISHTSTQYIDFVDFYISMDLSTNYFAHFSGC